MKAKRRTYGSVSVSSPSVGDQLVVLRVWDRGPTAPLLVQPNSQPELVYELSPYLSGYVRVLWR